MAIWVQGDSLSVANHARFLEDSATRWAFSKDKNLSGYWWPRFQSSANLSTSMAVTSTDNSRWIWHARHYYTFFNAGFTMQSYRWENGSWVARNSAYHRKDGWYDSYIYPVGVGRYVFKQTRGVNIRWEPMEMRGIGNLTSGNLLYVIGLFHKEKEYHGQLISAELLNTKRSWGSAGEVGNISTYDCTLSTVNI